MARIKRNGEGYSEGDVTVTMSGMQDVNPSSVKYGYTYAHEGRSGLRRKNRSWTMGKRETNCSLTLPLDVVAEFEKIAPDGDIALIRPFPITVTYFNPENEMIVDVIIAKFQGNGREVTGDGGEIEMEYEMFVVDMQLNK